MTEVEPLVGAEAAPPLGRLELDVIEVVWRLGECNVRDVLAVLTRPLAYTTVMTTLDRLFKKGLLQRHKAERAFIYSARLSRPEWERRRAGDFVAGFLGAPPSARGHLLSYLLDAVEHHDDALLDELQAKIRERRRQLNPRPRG